MHVIQAEGIRLKTGHRCCKRETIIAGANFQWDDLFLAAGNLSLFGGNKLVDLRIPSGKPGREGSEALQRYVSTLGPGIVTLITLPELDWQSKKAAWVVALSNASMFDIPTCLTKYSKSLALVPCGVQAKP